MKYLLLLFVITFSFCKKEDCTPRETVYTQTQYNTQFCQDSVCVVDTITIIKVFENECICDEEVQRTKRAYQNTLKYYQGVLDTAKNTTIKMDAQKQLDLYLNFPITSKCN